MSYVALETILKLGNPTKSKSRFTKSFFNGTICPLNQVLTCDPLGGIERPHTSYQIFCPSIIPKWPLSKWIVKTLLDVKGRSGTIMENCLCWKERYNKTVNCLCSRTTSVLFDCGLNCLPKVFDIGLQLSLRVKRYSCCTRTVNNSIMSHRRSQG
jgi:hypothetical protein